RDPLSARLLHFLGNGGVPGGVDDAIVVNAGYPAPGLVRSAEAPHFGEPTVSAQQPAARCVDLVVGKIVDMDAQWSVNAFRVERSLRITQIAGGPESVIGIGPARRPTVAQRVDRRSNGVERGIRGPRDRGIGATGAAGHTRQAQARGGHGNSRS